MNTQDPLPLDQTSPTRPRSWRRSRKMFGPRCLAPLLDLRADQKVLFLGQEPSLIQSMERRGVLPLSATLGPPQDSGEALKRTLRLENPTIPLPLDDVSVHHVLAPTVNADGWSLRQLSELARVMAPGATLMFGASSRLRFPLRRAAQTPGSGRRLLTAAGFTDTRVYGVRHGFHDPRFLVPLDHAGARTWFFASLYPPQKIQHARLAGILAHLPRTGFDQVYFPQLLFTAKRDGDRTC